MMKTFKIDESVCRFPYMVFFKSKDGWPQFYLYEKLEDAEKGIDALQMAKLKPVLYLNLSDAEVVEDD